MSMTIPPGLIQSRRTLPGSQLLRDAHASIAPRNGLLRRSQTLVPPKVCRSPASSRGSVNPESTGMAASRHDSPVPARHCSLGQLMTALVRPSTWASRQPVELRTRFAMGRTLANCFVSEPCAQARMPRRASRRARASAAMVGSWITGEALETLGLRRGHRRRRPALVCFWTLSRADQ